MGSLNVSIKQGRIAARDCFLIIRSQSLNPSQLIASRRLVQIIKLGTGRPRLYTITVQSQPRLAQEWRPPWCFLTRSNPALVRLCSNTRTDSALVTDYKFRAFGSIHR